jgi:hypothetical protein
VLEDDVSEVVLLDLHPRPGCERRAVASVKLVLEGALGGVGHVHLAHDGVPASSLHPQDGGSSCG